MAVTLAAQVGVIPLILLYFNKISLISLLSNLLVVPVLEIVTILGMLMAILGQISISFSQLIGYANCVLLNFILFVTKLSAEIPFSTVKLPTPSIAMVLAYYGSMWYLLWYMPYKKICLNLKHASVAMALVTVIVFFNILIPGELKVTFLDVGEGDSAFIRTSTGKTVLIDGGGSTNPNKVSGIGESVVLPFLLDSGVSELDLVIATHGHADHIQGLKPVLEQMKVGSLIIPYSENIHDFDGLIKAAEEKGENVTACSAGDVIRLDNKTELEVLFPIKNVKMDYSTLNDDSLVLKLHYGEVDVLFMGDAQKEVEQVLLEKKTELGADVIKIAHHGSDTSTSEAFLDSVKPKAAIICVGRNNFGHPCESILNLLEDHRIRLFRTDKCGAVILSSNGRNIKVSGTVTGD